jgi:hypothetical protein
MWIEHKGDSLIGPARIGWAKISQHGKRIEYGGKIFRSLHGRGFKTNYYDLETGEHYWISGCHKDGRDALYGTTVVIDEDALEEYWLNIREMPENLKLRKFRAGSKY